MRAPRSPQPTTAPKNFTAQVMARLMVAPPPPDPRLRRARRIRARASLFARVYITLILVATVVIAVLALLAPWTLITLLAAVISTVLLVVTGIAFIGRATGGFVSGLGVLYAAMLAALTPSLLMLAHRFRRQRSRLHQ
jgi:uncharacterized membrane protein